MQAHILVFDSGLGGTTVLQELQKLLPDCSYSYALDNAAFPYGGKTDQFLLQRSRLLFQQLIAIDKPDIVVIACNTASTLLLESLRKQYPETHFIGVVPAIKPAAMQSKSKVIALLATPATIARPYIDHLQARFAQDCQLVRLADPMLAILAERKLRDNLSVDEEVALVVEQIKQHPLSTEIDTIVLGCTHYPAINQELAEAWGGSMNWVDSGEAIAKRAKVLVESMQGKTRNSHLFLSTSQQQDSIHRLLSRYIYPLALQALSL